MVTLDLSSARKLSTWQCSRLLVEATRAAIRWRLSPGSRIRKLSGSHRGPDGLWEVCPIGTEKRLHSPSHQRVGAAVAKRCVGRVAG